MKNRLVAALALVCASVCISATASGFGRSYTPQLCGHLTAYIPRLMQEFGWTQAQAVGALANFAHESRGMAIEQIGTRPGTGGFGWAQWTGVRRYAFMSFARAHRMPPTTDAANYAFLSHELHTSFSHVASRMRQTRSVAEATTVFARDYEGAFGPGAVSAMASRHRWAQTLGGMTYVATAR